MYTVLLSGGSGKRLWPLSNTLRSKQYIKLLQSEESGEPCSMVQRVWDQLSACGLLENTVVCASKGQQEILRSQLGAINLAVEPARRDTFPAVALSCSYIKSKLGASASDVVCVLPVDPYTDMQYFRTLRRLPDVLERSGAQVALMGTTPTEPSSKFGYILPSAFHDGYADVAGFREKPPEHEAAALIERGAVWNCGVFCLRIGDVLAHLAQYGAPTDYDALYAHYELLPKISFDYEVLEKADQLAFVSFDGLWKDLGTWNTLTEEMRTSSIGDCLLDETCQNTNVINNLDIPVVTAGLKDAVVVASFDGILVADKQEAARVKDIVALLDRPPMYEERRWGTIKVLDTKLLENGTYNTTRKIKMYKGSNSSYHYHINRDEVWTILQGDAEIIVSGIRQLVHTGDVLRVPRDTLHAVHALSDLWFIEVQIGSTIADTDINRVTLDWQDIQCR